jgi:hypothetical protein
LVVFINQQQEKTMSLAEIYYTKNGAWISKGQLEDSLYRNKDTSFEAIDDFGHVGIAWRTKDVHEGTYLFMCYDTENERNITTCENMAYFSRKLESELRRIDEEIREGARQVSNIGLPE